MWCLTLRRKYKLQVYENKVFRNISESKMDKVSGQFRILHNEELWDFYNLCNIVGTVKSMRM
jgi:hypothetical protein